MMKIIEEGIIYSGENNPKLSSCAFPALCQLSDGHLLASFRAGETKGPYNKTEQSMICISADNGKTWSEPVAFFEPPMVNGKPTTLRTGYFLEVAPDNLMGVVNAVDATMEDLPYYNEETEGLKDTYIMVAHSADGGKTWTDLERVQV